MRPPLNRKIPTVGEVAAAYRPKFANELRTEWAIALLYRPVSFVVTPLFAACAVSPSAVTLLSLACALLLPGFALTGGASAWICVGALGIAFVVLDCVDGDLARVTGRASRPGAYADFLTDLVYRVALYAAIGILVDRAGPLAFGTAVAAPGANAGLIAGLACALLAIVARACRLYLGASDRDTGEAPERTATRASTGDVAIAFLSGLDHLLPLGVLGFGALGRLDGLLAYLFAYSLGDFLLTQHTAWTRLR